MAFPLSEAYILVDSKCDLCLNTPYRDETGAPNGRQACVETCPQQAGSMQNQPL